MEGKEKKQMKSSTPQSKSQEKRLSKVGKWLRSNEEPIILSYDARAILK